MYGTVYGTGGKIVGNSKKERHNGVKDDFHAFEHDGVREIGGGDHGVQLFARHNKIVSNRCESAKVGPEGEPMTTTAVAGERQKVKPKFPPYRVLRQYQCLITHQLCDYDPTLSGGEEPGFKPPCKSRCQAWKDTQEASE